MMDNPTLGERLYWAMMIGRNIEAGIIDDPLDLIASTSSYDAYSLSLEDRETRLERELKAERAGRLSPTGQEER
jgi:hypothetical protein